MKYDAVYARQSLFKKDSLSIVGQIEQCQSLSETNLKVYKDAGYSGKNTDRPGFQKLMKDIRLGRIRRLYVYRLDRFSRSVSDFSQLWEILQEHGVEFISVNENFDTTTPMGRAMLHCIMIFAQLERETTAERVKDNYYRRASLGSWPGGPAPYGYRISRTVGTDGRNIPILIPDDNSKIVERIYKEYMEEDMSLGKLARKLSEEGIPGPKRKTWDSVTLSRILHNPTYVMADEQVRLYLLSVGANVTSNEEDFDGVHGILLVGKRLSSSRKYTSCEGQSAAVMNGEGVIDSALWLKCQAKLNQNRQVANNGKGTHTWLSGLLKCARCGYSMKVAEQNGRRWLYCSGRYHLSACDSTIKIRLSELENEIAGEIEKLLPQCLAVGDTPQSDQYQVELRELDRRADRLIAAFAESKDMPQTYLQRALGQLESERQTIMESRRREAVKMSFAEIESFAKLPFKAKKAVAAQFIRRIEVGETDATVSWNV